MGFWAQSAPVVIARDEESTVRRRMEGEARVRIVTMKEEVAAFKYIIRARQQQGFQLLYDSFSD